MTAALSPFYQLCSKINFNKVFISVCKRNFCVGYTVTKKLNCQSDFLSKYVNKRDFFTNGRLCGTPGAAAAKTSVTGGQGLSKQQAEELTLRLTSEERLLLLEALQEYQSKIIKDEYLGKCCNRQIIMKILF